MAPLLRQEKHLLQKLQAAAKKLFDANNSFQQEFTCSASLLGGQLLRTTSRFSGVCLKADTKSTALHSRQECWADACAAQGVADAVLAEDGEPKEHKMELLLDEDGEKFRFSGCEEEEEWLNPEEFEPAKGFLAVTAKGLDIREKVSLLLDQSNVVEVREVSDSAIRRSSINCYVLEMTEEFTKEYLTRNLPDPDCLERIHSWVNDTLDTEKVQEVEVESNVAFCVDKETDTLVKIGVRIEYREKGKGGQVTGVSLTTLDVFSDLDTIEEVCQVPSRRKRFICKTKKKLLKRTVKFWAWIQLVWMGVSLPDWMTGMLYSVYS